MEIQHTIDTPEFCDRIARLMLCGSIVSTNGIAEYRALVAEIDGKYAVMRARIAELEGQQRDGHELNMQMLKRTLDAEDIINSARARRAERERVARTYPAQLNRRAETPIATPPAPFV